MLISAGAGGAVLAVAWAFWSSTEAVPAVLAPSQQPALVRHIRRRANERRLGGQLPGFLEEIARSLRAGLSVRSALEASWSSTEAPLGHDLEAMIERLGAGSTLQQTLTRWADERAGIQGVRLVTAAVSLAAESGASVAEAIDGVADTLREELGVHAEVRALASQAEASAVLVAVLPVAFAVVAAVADTQTLSFMVETGLGQLCLLGGLALDLLAFAWMRRITAAIA